MFDSRSGLIGGGVRGSDRAIDYGSNLRWAIRLSRRVMPLLDAHWFPMIGRYEPNKPLLGKAFCPRPGNKGASARLASSSRRLGGL
jgi:hypothetical protein